MSGLSSGGLTLTDNGGDSLSVGPGETDFAFATALSSGTAYDVAVATQPSGESCTVTNGSGTINDSDVTNVQIACSSSSGNATASETVLYSFTGGADGGYPLGGLVMDSAGNVYGTTSSGGAYGNGTVFKLAAPSDTESVLHSFTSSDAPTGCGSGGITCSGLIIDSAGNLYGTTNEGGTDQDGMVYKVTQTGTEVVLYSFTGTATGNDGDSPMGSLIMESAGNLYGTTSSGGTGNLDDGTVFKLTPSGTESVLYSFGTNGSADGADPMSGLIVDSAGNFYGTTEGGGGYDYGTVFKLTSSGAETVLYSFTGGSDGEFPEHRLVMDSTGNFYGTTYSGGNDGIGTVFEVMPSGSERVLHSFSGGADDGVNPSSGLTMDSAGNLYGVTWGGGAYGNGTVFKIQP